MTTEIPPSAIITADALTSFFARIEAGRYRLCEACDGRAVGQSEDGRKWICSACAATGVVWRQA